MRKNKVFPVKYFEPYHHYVDLSGLAYKETGMGFEYLNYISVIIDYIRSSTFKNILDFGCGDGKLLYELSKAGIKGVGIDLSVQGVSFAKAYLQEQNIFQGNISDFSEKWKGKYNLITAIEVFEHIKENEIEIIQERLYEILHNEGRLLICVPSKRREVIEGHYRHYDKQLILVQFQLFKEETTMYIHKNNIVEKLLRNFMANRYFILKKNKIQQTIYSIYKKITQYGKANNTTHIIMILKKKGI